MIKSLSPLLKVMDIKFNLKLQKDDVYRCIVYLTLKEKPDTVISPLVCSGTLDEIEDELADMINEHLNTTVLSIAEQATFIQKQLKKATEIKEKAKSVKKKASEKKDDKGVAKNQTDLLQQAEEADKAKAPAKRTRKTVPKKEEPKTDTEKIVEEKAKVEEPQLDFGSPDPAEETKDESQQELLW